MDHSKIKLESTLCDNYDSFLTELQKTHCKYDTDGELTLSERRQASSERQKRLSELISKPLHNVDYDVNKEEFINQGRDFLNLHIAITKNVFRSRSIDDINDDEYFRYYAKGLSKLGETEQGNKIFFLTKKSENDPMINLGSIIREQYVVGLKTNIRKIRNYIFMLFASCATTIHTPLLKLIEDPKANVSPDDCMAPEIDEFYIEIVRDTLNVLRQDIQKEISSDDEVEVDEDINNQISNICFNMVDSIVPDTQMQDAFKSMMGNQEMKKVMDGLIKATCSKTELRQLKRELKQCNEDDMNQMISDTKNALGSFNLENLSKMNFANMAENIQKTTSTTKDTTNISDDVSDESKQNEINDNIFSKYAFPSPNEQQSINSKIDEFSKTPMRIPTADEMLDITSNVANTMQSTIETIKNQKKNEEN